MPPTLSDMEQKILDYMVQYLRENTYQPSIREIGERFGIKSTKTVSEHLQALATKGYLERDPSRSRGVRILGMDLNPQTVSVPCYRRLPEPGTGPSTERAEMYLTLDRRLAGEKGGFFVRAREGELEALGISEGDYVLIEPARADALRNGALVVARIGMEPRYYQFSRNGRGVVLEPVRSDESPTIVENPSMLSLVGRVSAVYRRFDGGFSPTSVTAH